LKLRLLRLFLILLTAWSLSPAPLAPIRPAPAQTQTSSSPIVKVEAEPSKGFQWPYYLFVPPAVRADKSQIVRTLLVLPNNTGRPDDDFSVHQRTALGNLMGSMPIASQMGVVLLRPVFPRPKSDWRVYTHALDRDTLLAKAPTIERLDRQLLAMIDHAAPRLAAEGVKVDKKVVMFGFSASGMFVNRFVFLHPERVKAAAIGSPGGWPIAPIASWKGTKLPYPIGIADLKSVVGTPFKKNLVEKLPVFIFMGAEDTNDSVVFGDSYEPEEKKLVFDLFGKTPVERWPVVESIYRKALPSSQFKLYPNTGHRLTKEMMDDVTGFLSKHCR
jgi:pimeloyl-ACP methyl ester carboxylesterase